MRQEAREKGYRAYFSHDKLVVITNEGKRNSYTYDLDKGVLKCVLKNFKDNASWGCGRSLNKKDCAPSKFRLLSLNVDDMSSKLHDPEFVVYIKSFSFICLTEIFVQDIDTHDYKNIFDGLSLFIAPARKLSNYGGCSGGVICLIKTNILHFFNLSDTLYDNVLIFRINKELFKTPTDIILFAAYIPPASSPYYVNKDSTDGIVILEEIIMSTLGNDNYSIMLCGDLNSRTGKLNIIRDIAMSNIRDDFVDETRSSHDLTVNNFGRSLLSMCAALELTILNGSSPHIASGNFTYISLHGNSVVDYLITSFDLLELCFIIKVDENILSPHMPIEAIYHVTRNPENQSGEQDLPHTVFCWRLLKLMLLRNY